MNDEGVTRENGLRRALDGASGSGEPLASGRNVALLMLALGVAAALFAGWFYFTLQRRPLAFWGPDVARQLLRARRVVAMQLVPRAAGPRETADDETVIYAGQRYEVVGRRDVSEAPGFTHVRHSLLNDAAFSWDEPVDGNDAAYRYALRFEGEDGRATLLLDAQCRQVAVVETGRRAVIEPVSKPICDFLQEQFARASASSDGDVQNETSTAGDGSNR